MTTVGNGRKGLADRRGDNGELFGGEMDGLHPSREPQQAAEQVHAPKAAEPQNRQVHDQMNYEPLDVRQEREGPIRPVSAPEQTPAPLKQAIVHYPLLEALLAQRGLPMKGIWTVRDVAQIFRVSVRTILGWTRKGDLVPRDLPGRGRFLAEDLEAFLRESSRNPKDKSKPRYF